MAISNRRGTNTFYREEGIYFKKTQGADLLLGKKLEHSKVGVTFKYKEKDMTTAEKVYLFGNRENIDTSQVIITEVDLPFAQNDKIKTYNGDNLVQTIATKKANTNNTRSWKTIVQYYILIG